MAGEIFEYLIWVDLLPKQDSSSLGKNKRLVEWSSDS